MGGMSDSLNQILGVILIIVVLPIFAALGMLSAAASAGIISMQTIIVQFLPLFGIGAAFALLAGFGLLRRGA